MNGKASQQVLILPRSRHCALVTWNHHARSVFNSTFLTNEQLFIGKILEAAPSLQMVKHAGLFR